MASPCRPFSWKGSITVRQHAEASFYQWVASISPSSHGLSRPSPAARDHRCCRRVTAQSAISPPLVGFVLAETLNCPPIEHFANSCAEPTFLSMSCGFPAAQRVYPDGGNAQCPGRHSPWHARLPWTPKNRGLIRLPERVLKAPTIRHSLPENQRSQHCRHSRLWRARIRAAELSRKNRTGLQVQASIGLQVPPHFSDRSRQYYAQSGFA